MEKANAPNGRFYWICHNILTRLRASWEKRCKLFVCMTIAFVIFLAIARAWVQPAVLALRIYSFELIVFTLGALVLMRYRRRLRWRGWVVIVGLLFIIGLNHWYVKLQPHRYITLYLCYNTLDIKELDALPETDYERVQPLNSIRVLGKETMTEVQQVSDPFFVRVDNQYRWTMSVQPSFSLPRLFGEVTDVISVSATTPSPNFSPENKHRVSFPVGEKLFLGKNTHIAAIRSFGIARFISYEPADVKYAKDDNGEWVQLVSLVKWRGFFFPRPEFGGVQVNRQSKGGLVHLVKMMFFGEGEWIPPEEVASHAYLRGQNLVPYEVGRYVAKSFRFQNGFFAPFPGFHRGDVRIPDLPSDMNDQPFITFFRFKEGQGESKLYQYFALEPYEESRQGLNTSILFPADGVGPIWAYYHSKRNESLVGVSTIAAKVMESRKYYDWNQSRPAEHRPYIKVMDGKIRFMWLTTVVTYKAKVEGGEYIAGSTPEVVLTDAVYRQVVWMNPLQPPTDWPAELTRALSAVWKAD